MLFPLPHLAVLAFEGPDARTFLQSQLSCDLRALPLGAAQFGSWCNAQGRVISFGLLACETEEKWLWIVPTAELAELSVRLARFRLRAKVQIAADPRYVLAASSGWALPDGRFLALSAELPSGSAADWQIALQAWRLADIRAGLPWAGGGERFIAQMLGLAKLGALSLSKGCYPGQEVIARIHYKGEVKRTLIALRSEIACVEAALVAPSVMQVVDTNGVEVGEVVQVAANAQGQIELLAVLQNAAGESLQLAVNDRNIRLKLRR